MTLHIQPVSRRRLLLGSLTSAGVGMLANRSFAAKRPAITRPRATSGDDAIEPNWKERVTVTVGPREADLVGSNEKAFQAAIDYVSRLGGGTVHILPGTYRLRNAVYLSSKVRLLGSGP